jgi:predicted O-methyltransferase YrrM
MLDRVRDVLAALHRERPRFHGPASAAAVNLRLHREALDLLAEHLDHGMRTLETGSGSSTTLFAAAGAHHTAISPLTEEHGRIRAWLSEQGVDAAGIGFVAAASQDVLPRLAPDPLDVVLIDGDHAFPAPFIDWYYTAEHVKVGGLVIVDDTNVVTGAILRDFLAAERQRWALVADLKKTSAFRKLCSPSVRGVGWWEQPSCARKLSFPRVERWLAPVHAWLFRRS